MNHHVPVRTWKLVMKSIEDCDITEPVDQKNVACTSFLGGVEYSEESNFCYICEDGFAIKNRNWS